MTRAHQARFGALVAGLMAATACLGTSPTPSSTTPLASSEAGPPTPPMTRPSPPGRITPCEVTVVGDSLGVGAVRFGRFGEQLSRGGACRLLGADVRTSRTTAQGAVVVERLAETNRLGSVVVVVLGANDCAARPFEASARRLLAAAGTRPVIWSTTWHKCAIRVNSVLGRLALEPGSPVRLVDHPTWRRGRAGDLTRDQLHLQARGASRLARGLVDTVGLMSIPSTPAPAPAPEPLAPGTALAPVTPTAPEPLAPGTALAPVTPTAPDAPAPDTPALAGAPAVPTTTVL